jgi:transposase InsO family protein
MKKHGLIHAVKHTPNGITKADKQAQKSDDLIKRDFTAEKPLTKAITDITELPTADGKLYLSCIFDCYDLMPIGLAMADNMRAELCEKTLESLALKYGKTAIKGLIAHSDRGSQYTSELYRNAIRKYEILQSMNSAAGKCHDNARCESIWGRMKEELIYGRYDTKKMSIEAVKSLVWRYFMGYFSNRRICSAIGGIPPAVKRQRYYESLKSAA